MPARCFLAFDLPPDTVRRLDDTRRAFLSAAPDWAGEKWVDSALLHVTLKFIGPLDDAVVPAATAALVAACAALPPAAVVLTSVRTVPSPRRATMLWAEMRDASGGMTALARTVDEALASPFGVPPCEREFAPHVTLARARRPRPVPSGPAEQATACLVEGSELDRTMSVHSLTLYASTLRREGPTYEALGLIPVGKV